MNYYDYSAGDRVLYIGNAVPELMGQYGTVLAGGINPAVRFDSKFKNGHNCGGLCESGHGWWPYPENIVLADSSQNDIAVDVNDFL